jgi:hypothetical protein
MTTQYRSTPHQAIPFAARTNLAMRKRLRFPIHTAKIPHIRKKHIFH